MNKIKSLFHFIILNIFTALVLGSGHVHASGITQFDHFLKNTQSAKGEFSQHILKNINGENHISEKTVGYFKFLRPKKFIWAYKKPYEQIIQSDGVNFYIYDKDMGQVTVRPVGKDLGMSPAAFLFGDKKIHDSFLLKDAGKKDGLDWLEGTPISLDSGINKIEIGLNENCPHTLAIHDSFGQVTILIFKKFNSNIKFKKNDFLFVIPNNVDIYRQENN